MSRASQGSSPPLPAVVDESFPDVTDGSVTDTDTASGRGRYTGAVAAGRMHGAGSLTTPLGTYTGVFAADQLEGEGSYTAAGPSPDATAAVDPSLLTPMLPSVARYNGGFHLTKFEGKGTVQFKDGGVYQGLLVGGLPDDPAGSYTHSDGRAYRGGYRGGVRHGHGQLRHANGDTYDGEFVGGAMTGFGTATYAGGARVFTGLWDSGAKVKGKLSFPGCDRMYDGQWRDERPHGTGAMVFANGDRYEGDFVNGMLQGVGLLTYACQSGRRLYYGQFFEDQPHGCGQLISYPPSPESGSSGEAGASSGPAAAPAVLAPTIVEGYFMNGQLLPADDVESVEEVVAATKGLPLPQARPPFLSEGEGRPVVSQTVVTNDDVLAAAPPTIHAEASEAANQRGSPAAEEDLVSLSSMSEEVGNNNHGNGDSDDEEGEGLSVEEALAAGLVPVAPDAPHAAENCTGWLEKCSIGRSTLGFISNWKRRFFVLAPLHGNVCLGYYEDELCRKPIGFLRLSPEDTRIVTRPSKQTHKKASKPGRELCIIYHERRKTFKLLLRAVSPEEHSRWAAALLRHFTIVDRPSDHPLPGVGAR